MKYLIICLLTFVISAFSQNHKKVKILISNEFDLNKAAKLSLDLEDAWHDKSGNISLFVNDDEFSKLQQSGLGFEGSYNPAKQGPSYVDGEGYYGATSSSGEVSYGDLAFDSYDRSHYISLKENYHRTRILGGEKVLQEVPKGFSNVAQEEARGFLYAYKNRGLYPSIPQSNFLSNIRVYQWASFGFDLLNSFQESWWHFIYRIPRRF